MKVTTEEILLLKSSRTFNCLLFRFAELLRMHNGESLALYSIDKINLSMNSEKIDIEHFLEMLSILNTFVKTWKKGVSSAIRCVYLPKCSFAIWETHVERQLGCLASLSPNRLIRVSFDPTFFRIEVPEKDEEFYLYFETLFSKKVLEHNKKIASFSERVFRTIFKFILEDRTASLKSVAQQLSISSRSLQRELKNERSSFQIIKNKVRMHILQNTASQDTNMTDQCKLIGLKSRSSVYRISSKRAA